MGLDQIKEHTDSEFEATSRAPASNRKANFEFETPPNNFTSSNFSTSSAARSITDSSQKNSKINVKNKNQGVEITNLSSGGRSARTKVKRKTEHDKHDI